MKKTKEHKYFDGRKYYLNQERWLRVTCPRVLLSHDTWNYYNPNDKINKNEVIHHINEDKSDDRIENLEKMLHGEHSRLHNSGKNNSKYKGGIKQKQIYLCSKQINNQGYQIYQYVNSLGEVFGSGFTFIDKRNKKRKNKDQTLEH